MRLTKLCMTFTERMWSGTESVLAQDSLFVRRSPSVTVSVVARLDVPIEEDEDADAKAATSKTEDEPEGMGRNMAGAPHKSRYPSFRSSSRGWPGEP
jgi:hypothetical protein